VPEFFGDVAVVNAKIWPFVDVEPRRYRLRIVNGSQWQCQTYCGFVTPGGSVIVPSSGSSKRARIRVTSPSRVGLDGVLAPETTCGFAGVAALSILVIA
jgi:hypothetical protein